MSSSPDISTPSLKPLAALIGEWRVELAFPTDPPVTVTSGASFEWFEDGAFLVMRTGSKDGGGPHSTCVVGRDASTEHFTALYSDDRGVSRVYQMSVEGRTWRQWRDAPRFSQRFIAEMSDDGNSISARWEKSTDGVRWEHDFNLTYTRLR